MADAKNPWPELVEAARAQIKRANTGNRRVAHEALRQAAVGLRDVLKGRQPDPERLEYLAFLLTAVKQINQGVPVPPRNAKVHCTSLVGEYASCLS